MSGSNTGETEVAVIGMAGRFPGAKTIEQFWENLCSGRETVSFFTDEEIENAWIKPSEFKGHSNFIKARGVLEGAELFDAAFFEMSPKEAEITDPQHRIFLECASEALEAAGCNPDTYSGAIGVFGGMSMATYLHHNIMSHPGKCAELGEYPIAIGNDKDYLTTRVSYKLNLKGPSLNIQTACSTSLVAVCSACQSLLNHECDMALAGGVAISFPQKRGYLHQTGGINSADGHCRAFDAGATGTVAGDGVGIIVLKRLTDALADGDCIHAIIKGFAVNNDGGSKMGYSAPSPEGQAKVIAAAHAMAGVDPNTITYVEAHGTGTPLGDPIEIAGLTSAFGTKRGSGARCAIGSVKSNIGHLDAASGIAGLIKTVMALKHKVLPPSLHFQQPNPQIDFASGPFFVNRSLSSWVADKGPLRAGVSSFGIGGTNAHVVVEEAPENTLSEPSRKAQLIPLSAKSASALKQAAANLADYFDSHPGVALPDVAFTLQTGRRTFAHRLTLLCNNAADASAALHSFDKKKLTTAALLNQATPSTVFMFPGQGAQIVDTAREIYETEPSFAEIIDQGCEMLKPLISLDLRSILFPDPQGHHEACLRLQQTEITQPAMFIIEYALAKLWMSWGIYPDAMIGHSLGEYVAACLAGVFTFEDALQIVASRGRLMQNTPEGAMLAIRMSESEVQPYLQDRVSLSAVNGVSLCVVSGSTNAISQIELQLAQKNIGCVRLQTSRAFHSILMEPILKPFLRLLNDMQLAPPQIPFISNVTGNWITAEQATNPEYWVSHVRQAVRFADGLSCLLEEGERVLLEVGPGHTLTGLARQHPKKSNGSVVVSTFTDQRLQRSKDDTAAVLTALGELWLAGVDIDWGCFYRRERRQRLPLPTYPFERKSYWIPPAKIGEASQQLTAAGNSSSESLRSLLKGNESNYAPVPSNDSNTGEEDNPVINELKELFATLSGFSKDQLTSAEAFVSMGFDSLFFVQASLAIERQFGIQIAFRQLLGELSTFTSLAGHIHSRLRDGADSAAIPARKAEVAMDASASKPECFTVALSDAQKEIWWATQMGEEASRAYNESRILHLLGPLDVSAMCSAVQMLVERHESLRTVFSQAGDNQRVLKTLKLEIPFIDLSVNEPQSRHEQELEIKWNEANRSFDLFNGPLIRCAVIKLGQEEHLVIITIHHIVCDGQSWGILLPELSRLYESERRGIKDTLNSPWQPRNIGRNNIQIAEKRLVDAAEQFWMKQFESEPPVLALPTKSRTTTPGFNGSCVSREIYTPSSQTMVDFGSRHDCTLFTTLLAAYAVLLRGLTQQEDLVIGIPVAGRQMPRGEAFVGHSVNFLPLRLHVSSEATFTECLNQTKEAFLQAFEHRQCTFGRLLQKLNLRRDSFKMPLVSATFNVDRLSKLLQFPGLTASIESNTPAYSLFDFSLNVSEIEGVLRASARYNSENYSAETIRQWLGHFQHLLEELIARPDLPVSHLSLLSVQERQEILIDWNKTQEDYPRELCVHQLFEAQVQRSPETVALKFNGKELSYRQLNTRADRLAVQLQALGAGPDVPIGICLKRSDDMLVAVLAILKAGSAYVPIDPAYPEERKAFIIENTKMPFVLVSDESAIHTGSLCRRVKVDELEQPATQDTGLCSLATSNNLAYIIYTSGSTGTPKGVAMEHRPLVNLISWQIRNPVPAPGTKTLQFTSLSFDVSFQEIFSTWCSGGTLLLINEHLRRDTVQLLRFIAEQGVERLFLPFVALHQLAEASCELELVPRHLREVMTAGEQLRITPQVRGFFSRLRNCRLYNQYGPTESHVIVTSHLLSGSAANWLELPPIGKPIANARMYVLDQALEPVAKGVTGELYIGGESLARGYLNQPELTSEKFVPDPFSNLPNARMYKTGDYARWTPAGVLEFLGRIDQQVKIRGYRVELGEIETVLGKYPGVRDCCVAVREISAGTKLLTAYVVADHVITPEEKNEWRRHLSERLPEFMVPSAFVALQKMPLTRSGKIDRLALPVPSQKHLASAAEYIAPRTPLEDSLSEIWCEILGLKRIGVADNFFELGGHSLLASRVISRIRSKYGIGLSLQRFFAAPTIAALAQTIEVEIVEDIKALSDDEAARLAHIN